MIMTKPNRISGQVSLYNFDTGKNGLFYWVEICYF